ncbi:hypothetical protein [Streptomyces sp. NPDC048669]|uniref:hypothetical protein n=1 Tax=Streptomyces sp. NPDC048669 TaxID=3155267 RepID=UPI00341A932B
MPAQFLLEVLAGDAEAGGCLFVVAAEAHEFAAVGGDVVAAVGGTGPGLADCGHVLVAGQALMVGFPLLVRGLAGFAHGELLEGVHPPAAVRAAVPGPLRVGGGVVDGVVVPDLRALPIEAGGMAPAARGDPGGDAVVLGVPAGHGLVEGADGSGEAGCDLLVVAGVLDRLDVAEADAAVDRGGRPSGGAKSLEAAAGSGGVDHGTVDVVVELGPVGEECPRALGSDLGSGRVVARSVDEVVQG